MSIIGTKSLAGLLKTSDKITNYDVRNFRQEIFRDGVVSREEAEAIIALNAEISNKCAAWPEYFVETLVDYTVSKAEPRGSVSIANGEWLASKITRDGKITGILELELLVKVIEKASYTPNFLATLALQQVAEAVLEFDGDEIFGHVLIKGKLGVGAVELLRRVLYANGGESGLSISKAEAEVLFDLNDKTIETENHPAWSDLFVKAIANYLMAVSGYRGVGRTESLRRDAWLEDTQTDVAAVLANSLRSIGQLFNKKTLLDTFSSDTDRMQNAWRDRVDDVTARQNIAKDIDEDEGKWLADRIGRDSLLHQNERALIDFIKQENPHVHPAVNELVKKLA